MHRVAQGDIPSEYIRRSQDDLDRSLEEKTFVLFIHLLFHRESRVPVCRVPVCLVMAHPLQVYPVLSVPVRYPVLAGSCT
jgi:hypothetical protein